MKENVRNLTFGALLCALDIIFTRFLSVMVPPGLNLDRISLQFLPNALSGMMFGPFWGALICAAGDMLGMAINSGGLSPLPVFTISAATRGAIFGLLLYKKNITYPRALAAMAIISVVVELGMGTAWQVLFYDKGVALILMYKIPVRIVTTFAYSSILLVTTKALRKAGVA